MHVRFVMDARRIQEHRRAAGLLSPPARVAVIAVIAAIAVTGVLSLCGTASGQRAERSSPRSVEDVLPLADFEDDPIGVDARPVDTTPAVRPSPPVDMLDDRFGPRPPAFRAQRGEVLTGVPALRETAHRIAVRLADGLAHVRIELTLESTSHKPAEAHYRLAVPPDAVEASLEVCGAAGCRSATPELTAAPHRSAYDAAIRARRAPDQDGPVLPVAHLARATEADRGPALLLRAAPLSKGAPLRLTIAYTAAAPMRGGVARMRLPARGMDARAAPAELTLEAPNLLGARIDGHPADDVPAELDAWVGAELSARAPAAASSGVSLSATHFPCGSRRCARVRAVAHAATPRPRQLLIALDVSPSTLGPARGRVGAALIELLAGAPVGTRVRALAFAGRARTLIDDAVLPEQVPLAPFARATSEAELGAATRFEAAWPTLAGWSSAPAAGQVRPLVVVVGDGGLTTGSHDPFASARKAGVEVSVINLADRATTSALRDGALSTGGAVIDAGRAAQLAARGHGSMRLREQLAALFAPTRARKLTVTGALDVEGNPARVGLTPLRAGEEVVWEGLVARRARLTVGGRSKRSRPTRNDGLLALGHRRARTLGMDGASTGLVAVDPGDLLAAATDWPHARPPRPPRAHRKPPACDMRGPAMRAGGLGSDVLPLALAHRGSCQPEPAPTRGVGVGRGMPAEPLLGMLRDRIVPVARGCFRRDRAGRPDYAVRAVFEFKLAEREIVEAAVTGELPEPLRQCLLGAVDRLEIPRFSGSIVVRYPLQTERERAAPRIELSRQAADRLDSVIGPAPADPLP